MRKRLSCRGVTIIELAATGAVLAVALVATAAAVASSAGLARTATQSRAVSRAATSLLEEVRGTRFDQLVSNWNGRTRTWTDIAGVGKAVTGTVTITDAGSGSTRWPVYRANVRVDWRGATGPESMTVTTLICDRNANGSGSSVGP